MRIRILPGLLAAAMVSGSFAGSTGYWGVRQEAAGSLSAPAGDGEYRIGQDDLLNVAVFEYPDMNTTARVTAAGRFSLPLVGVVTAAGRTARELELEIESALRDGFLNDPHVTVFVEEYGSQPVSVLGAVRQPDIYQIQGRKFLLDMIAMAGGLEETAGKTIQVIRRAGARAGASGALDSGTPDDTITIDVEDLFVHGRTELNILIRAGDVINVPEAGSIFVVGEVAQPGEFILSNGRNLTVRQALAKAGGFGADPRKSDSFITRHFPDGASEEIPVDLDRVIRNEAEDVLMLPNDILFVPGSPTKAGLRRALDAAVSVVTSRLIWH